MKLLLYAMAGGALGSGTRHLINIGMGRWLGPGFPWWTLAINVTGCFLMGALIETLALRFNSSNELRTFIATGVLGGYTTFSAFSLDFVTLMGRGEPGAAACYVIGSVVLALLAVYAGLWLTRMLLA
ncbi:MAG: fluoride efflux transporter CrcB [Hyphomicrobiaceae bacterium]|nr:fluoride efflux transporter CrcB [Hyphomicrobiaceae bacterium]